jgi:hypothetical protein
VRTPTPLRAYGAIDIEARGAMQKEKPLFEGIPNYVKTVEFIQNCLTKANQAPQHSIRRRLSAITAPPPPRSPLLATTWRSTGPPADERRKTSNSPREVGIDHL